MAADGHNANGGGGNDTYASGMSAGGSHAIGAQACSIRANGNKANGNWRRRLVRLLRLSRVMAGEFKLFLISASIAFVVSTVLLHHYYPIKELPPHHHSWLGVAYDTMQMVFFQSPIPFVDDWRLVPVFFGLPILGLVVIAEGVGHLGHLLVQNNLYTKEWQRMLAKTYDDHVIICGLGNVGFRVVEHLSRFGEDIVCVELNEDCPFLEDLRKYEVPVVFGDARRAQTLINANIQTAKALIVVTDNDLANLECALNARELRPGIRVVVRMFDQSLAQKIETAFGIQCAFSTSALSAPIFAQSALSKDILASFEFGSKLVNAYQYVVRSQCKAKGLTIDQLRNQFEVTVLMHERAGNVDWNPCPTITLTEEDKLLLLTENAQIHKLLV